MTTKTDNREFTNSLTKTKGYHRAAAVSIKAVRRFKNSDDRAFAVLTKHSRDNTELTVTIKEDDAALLSFMKWTDIFKLFPDMENNSFTFPEDDQPIVSVGWRGAGVNEKPFITNVTSQIKEQPAQPTPTIPPRSEDDVRHDLAKIASQYSIPESTFLLWIPEIGSIEDAAKDNVGAQFFLDKFQQKCLAHNLAKSGAPEMTPESAKLLLSGRSELPSHIETKEEKPVSDNPTQPDPDLQALKDKADDLNAWFPRDDVNDDERPAVLAVGEQAVADVQAIKDAKDADVIEGEIIHEETYTGAESQETDFKKAAGEQVATRLTAAFPDASKGWKYTFFKDATKCDTVNAAIDLHGPDKMFKMLSEAITEAKKNAANLPTTENAQEGQQKEQPATPTPETPSTPSAAAPDAKAGQSSSALEIAKPQQPSSIVRAQPRFLMPSKDEFDYMKELASAVSISKFYQNIDTKEKALVIMMKGFILGIDPISALDGIYIINGKPYLSAKLLKGLVERTNNCQRFDVVSEAERCTVTIQRRDRPSPNVYTFTKQDAITAQLWDSATWKKYPKDMLRNRCVMRAVKGEFPDVDLGPMASEDEPEFEETSAA